MITNFSQFITMYYKIFMIPKNEREKRMIELGNFAKREIVRGVNS